jgi:hypothetical protein
MQIVSTECVETLADAVSKECGDLVAVCAVLEDPVGPVVLFSPCDMSDDRFTDGDKTFTVTASSYYAPNAEKPYKAFAGLESSAEPGSDTNQWTTSCPLYSVATGNFEGTYLCCNTSVYGTNVPGEWLQLHSDQKHAVHSIRVTANFGNPSRAPRSFLLVGSDDEATWTLLHSEHAIDGWESKQSRVFVVPDETAHDSYHYFRLVVPETCGVEGWLTIDKLQFYHGGSMIT